MDLTLHCKLCDHKIIDFKTGTLCSLTSKKPDFQNKCGVIKMQDNFEEQIKIVNIEYEAVLKTKTDTFGHLIMYGILAFTLILGGFLLGKFILEKGIISTIPLIIMTIGLAALGFAFAPLNMYSTNLKIARKKKNTLDKISKMYGYQYDIDITHLKDSLGNKSYETDLKIRKTSNSR
ncbi:hypothetical protein [Psychroserpens sp. Hel_I_66]|uniref:hypothetical protein n=1 Tax=Psychroserpens sp. Hel_I_66 TaxID=1250004 RepID=UPI0012E0C08E|nr:hypothetical protein [Psychroserpens sp. Hel_I_66]